MTALGVGCAKRSVPAYKPADFKITGKDGCISSFGETMNAFTEGKLSEEQVTEFWNCMSRSIGAFERMTAGSGGGDNYAPEAVRHFIEVYFMKMQMPDDLLAAVMDLKRVLLSGSDQHITRSELQRLDGFFTQLKQMTLDLRPHVKVILRNKKSASDDEVREASAAIDSAMMRLAGWLGHEKQQYTFKEIGFLLNTFKSWMKENGGSGQTLDFILQAADLLPTVKSIMVGGDRGAIGGDEWFAVCRAISHGLGFYLEVSNGFEQGLDAALTRANLPAALVHLSGDLGQSADNHEDKTISLVEFRDLLTKLQELKWLPESLSPDKIEPIWNWVLIRLFGDGKNLTAEGLTFEQAAKLKKTLEHWRDLSAQLNPDLSRNFTKLILRPSAPLEWDEEGRLFYSKQAPEEWSARARAHLIWPYIILNLVKSAYAADPGATYMTEDEMTKAATEILPLLQSFGWLKDMQPSIGVRLLREADLFTSASNGDGRLDLSEGARYVAFVMSSFRMSQLWIESADQKCGDHQAECVRQLGDDSNTSLLSHMPRLQSEMKMWPRGKFIEYMRHSETIALGSDSSATLETGDLLQAFQVIQYVETFMLRFDRDSSERIDVREAQSAYPIYSATLAKLLGKAKLSPDQLNGFFTFLFRSGMTPFTGYDVNNPETWAINAEFNHWCWFPEKRRLNADRSIIMSILFQLATMG